MATARRSYKVLKNEKSTAIHSSPRPSRSQSKSCPLSYLQKERAMSCRGIEPLAPAWKADMLPLHQQPGIYSVEKNWPRKSGDKVT